MAGTVACWSLVLSANVGDKYYPVNVKARSYLIVLSIDSFYLLLSL
jgi:hypothetical protein